MSVPWPGVEEPMEGFCLVTCSVGWGGAEFGDSGAHDKLFMLNEPALHRAEDYLIQSEGTKLFSVRLLPDLFILKNRFEPGPERKKSCWVGIGLARGEQELRCDS